MADGKIFKLGNVLYKKAFPVYNIIYPIYKRVKERKEIAFLKRKIKRSDKVIDIGANIGFYSKILAGIVGKEGSVYCFEPDNENYKHLKKALTGLDNVSHYNMAVSDSDGKMHVYVSADLNVDHRTYPVEEYERIEEISGISIDSFLVDKEVPQFIKMDIQGFEVTALRGMRKTLKNTSNLKMLVEFWPFGLRQAGTGVNGLVEELLQYNMDVFTIENAKEKRINIEELLAYENWGWKQDLNLYIVFNSTTK